MVTVISFTLCVTVSFYDPVAAFYLLPTRAWELGCGAILAVYGKRLAAAIPALFHHNLAPLGPTILAVAFVYLNEKTLFPGYAAALPVLAAAMIILATERGGYCGQSLGHLYF